MKALCTILATELVVALSWGDMLVRDTIRCECPNEPVGQTTALAWVKQGQRTLVEDALPLVPMGLQLRIVRHKEGQYVVMCDSEVFEQ